MCLAAAFKPVFPDIFSLFECLLHITPLDMAGNIDVSFKAFVDLRGILLDRIKRFESSRQFFIFNVDKVESFLCNLFCYRCHCHNRLAYVTDFINRKHLLIAKILISSPDSLLYTKCVILTICNCYNTRKCQSFTCVYFDNFCMWVWAPEDLSIEHSRKLHVEGIGRPARDLGNAVNVVNMGIENPEWFMWIDYSIFVHDLTSAYLPFATAAMARTILL